MTRGSDDEHRVPTTELRVLVAGPRGALDRALPHLEAVGYRPQVRAHEEETALREALRRFRPEVVVAVRAAVRPEEERALAIAREEAPGAPLLLLVPEIRCGEIAGLLRRGVADVVPEEPPAALAVAVRAALHRSEERERRRAADEAVRESERRKLRGAMRLEAVGRLAGGIAHDFNNILTAITACSETLLEELEARDPHRPLVQEIAAASNRAASLTRQLLAFSRRQMLEPRVVDLNEVVTSVLQLLRRLIREDVALASDLESDLGCVRADPGQVEQVLLNLALNARDAMPGGGILTIRTRNREAAAPIDRGPYTVPAGRYVELALGDTGEGMREETRQRVFEPFFTTKQVGEGTGLGLATVYGIVKQSGGFIECRSAPGEGTTFEVLLPRVDQAADGPARARRRPETLTGSERILVVEDDPVARTVVRMMLARRGYQVDVADSAADAIRRLERSGPPDLLLTDAVMRDRPGWDLVREVRRRFPETKVLLMSGYAEMEGVPLGAEVGAPFIAKPFTPSDLALRVREVLDSAPSSG